MRANVLGSKFCSCANLYMLLSLISIKVCCDVQFVSSVSVLKLVKVKCNPFCVEMMMLAVSMAFFAMCRPCPVDM